MQNIIVPAQPHASLKDIQKVYPWAKKILSDDSPTEEVILNLDTYPQEYMSPEDYQKAREKDKGNLLGFSHMLWIYEHQDEFPELLKSLQAEDAWYIDFPSTVVRGGGGDGRFPCLVSSDRRFWQSWDRTGNELYRFGRVASRKSSNSDALTSGLLEPLTLEISVTIKGVEYKGSVTKA